MNTALGKQVSYDTACYKSVRKLPDYVSSKFLDLMYRYWDNPSANGLNLETVEGSKGKSLKSLRLDQSYRAIAFETPTEIIFVYVNNHDKAYHWAKGRYLKLDKLTNRIRIVKEIEQVREEVKSSDPRLGLFAAFKDKKLLSLGVAEEAIAIARTFETDEELEASEAHFDPLSLDILYALAAGYSEEEVYAIAGSTVDDTENTCDKSFEELIITEESRQTIFTPKSNEELRRFFDGELEGWRVWLHPKQKKLVNRHWNGPVCVLGGAGTGKTVVAMHRAKWLAQNIPATTKQRILFTTFSAVLATDIQHNLGQICTAEELARIEVKHINQWVTDYLKNSAYRFTIIEANHNELYNTMWSQALRLKDSTLELPDSFYREEWDRIIVPNQIYKKMSYLTVSRQGRGVALTRKQRSLIWPIFEELRAEMAHQSVRTFEDATLDIINEINSENHNLNYCSAIIDEGQDMGPEALTLIRKIVPEQPDDLFIVGDGHQRIYRQKTTMAACGIKIVGRSHKLKINYRTTAQTKKFAMSVLENTLVDDLNGNISPSGGYISLNQGEKPVVKQYNSLITEADGVLSQIAILKSDGVKNENICIVARNKKQLDLMDKEITARGIKTYTIDETNNISAEGVRLVTMSRVKGLEFHYVFIIAVNKGIVPLDTATAGTEDPVEARLRDLNERALFHVACSRAVKKLFVSSSGTISSYLADHS
jgi:superfamily I DNA/RNA helicase